MWPSDLFKANHRGPDVKFQKIKENLSMEKASKQSSLKWRVKGENFWGGGTCDTKLAVCARKSRAIKKRMRTRAHL